MTAIISVKCTDGVVIGVDSMRSDLTQGRMLNANTVRKLVCDKNKNVIATTSGDAIFGERFKRVALKAKLDVPDGNNNVTKSIRVLFESLGFIWRELDMSIDGFVGYVDENGDIQCAKYDGSAVSVKMKEDEWFKTAGTGEVQTLPLMQLFANIMSPDGLPNVKKAKFLVYWALKQAIKSSPGLIGNPIRIATIKKDTMGNIKTEYCDFGNPQNKVIKNEYEGYIREVIDAWTHWPSEFIDAPKDDSPAIPGLNNP